MFEINSRERKKETSLNNFPAFVWLCTQLQAYKSSFNTGIPQLERYNVISYIDHSGWL